MMADNIILKDFGPISNLDINLGDLTILIGAQASGKTLFLQMLKLLVDKDQIITTLNKYNYVTEGNVNNILNCYMGEGLSKLWTSETNIQLNGKLFHKEELLHKPDENAKESLFYVPAQRILSIADGRPKNFMEFDISAPYVLRNFSETLRLFFQKGVKGDSTLFPMSNHISDAIKESINQNIFHDGKVIIDEHTGQKKMQLQIDGIPLPFMTWSAGQKEFMPLLMAFYCLAEQERHKQYKYVVIEEPEMGLHPSAIQTVLLQILALIKDGYHVILSTHTPIMLDFAWTYGLLKDLPKDRFEAAMSELFVVHNDIFSEIQEKTIKTYYFSHKSDGSVSTKDISDLDVSADNIDVSEWGGISQFSTRASEVVSKYIEEYEA